MLLRLFCLVGLAIIGGAIVSAGNNAGWQIGTELPAIPPGTIPLILVALAVVVLYFLPTSIATRRELASGTGALFLVNLLFGWTLIGWLACLLWAALGQTRQQAAFYARGG